MSFRALRQSFQIWNFVSFRIRFVPDFAYEMIFIADNYYFSRLIFINDGNERGHSSSSYAEQSSSTGDSLAAAGPSRPVKPVPSCRRCRGNRFPSVPVSGDGRRSLFAIIILGGCDEPHAVLRRPPGDFVVVTYA